MTIFAIPRAWLDLQSQSSPPPPTQGTPPPPQTTPPPKESDNSDAAAKAAERKRRFEALKKQLENGEGTSKPSGTSSPAITYVQAGLLLAPAQVSMLVGEQQRFTLLDIRGNILKTTANWSVSNPAVADILPGDAPGIVAKGVGDVTVTASVDGLVGEAVIKVYPGDKLPVGTIKWAQPKIPGRSTTQIVPAVPH